MRSQPEPQKVVTYLNAQAHKAPGEVRRSTSPPLPSTYLCRRTPDSTPRLPLIQPMPRCIG